MFSRTKYIIKIIYTFSNININFLNVFNNNKNVDFMKLSFDISITRNWPFI